MATASASRSSICCRASAISISRLRPHRGAGRGSRIIATRPFEAGSGGPGRSPSAVSRRGDVERPGDPRPSSPRVGGQGLGAKGWAPRVGRQALIPRASSPMDHFQRTAPKGPPPRERFQGTTPKGLLPRDDSQGTTPKGRFQRAGHNRPITKKIARDRPRAAGKGVARAGGLRGSSRRRFWTGVQDGPSVWPSKTFGPADQGGASA